MDKQAILEAIDEHITKRGWIGEKTREVLEEILTAMQEGENCVTENSRYLHNSPLPPVHTYEIDELEDCVCDTCRNRKTEIAKRMVRDAYDDGVIGQQTYMDLLQYNWLDKDGE